MKQSLLQSAFGFWRVLTYTILHRVEPCWIQLCILSNDARMNQNNFKIGFQYRIVQCILWKNHSNFIWHLWTRKNLGKEYPAITGRECNSLFNRNIQNISSFAKFTTESNKCSFSMKVWLTNEWETAKPLSSKFRKKHDAG